MTAALLDVQQQVAALLGDATIAALTEGRYGSTARCVTCALPVDLTARRSPTSPPPCILASWDNDQRTASWRIAHAGCAESAVVPDLPTEGDLLAAMTTCSRLDQAAREPTLLVSPADPLRVRMTGIDAPVAPLLAAARRMGAQPLTRITQPLRALPGWTATVDERGLRLASPHGPFAAVGLHPEQPVPRQIRVVVSGISLGSVTGQPYEAVRRAITTGRAAGGLVVASSDTPWPDVSGGTE